MHSLQPHTLGEHHGDGDHGCHSRQRGVLLINLGTPDAPDAAAVRDYLKEFLSDPAVIRLPKGTGWLNGPLGRLIAHFRAADSAKMYSRIWSEAGSPLRTITEDQVRSLEAVLPRGWHVFYAMRYGRPGIAETLRHIESCGIDELIVLPMYPQYSEPTTGTALKIVCDYLKNNAHQFHVTMRTTWYDDHGYINAQAQLIEEYARTSGLTPDNSYLLFSTHGLPVSYVKRGDPYPQHIARTVALVGQRLGWPADRMSSAYQSRFGPFRWLEPYTDDMLVKLAEAGEKRVLVCPISFTVDCLETLEEIDIRYREILESHGSDLFLCPALNTYAPFISALKHLVLRGPRPMGVVGSEERCVAGPEKTRIAAGGVDNLVMVGVSRTGKLGEGQGPAIRFSSEDALRHIKKSQAEVPDLLRAARKETGLSDAWLWNTCHRFELYGYVGDTSNDEAMVATIRRHLFGNCEPEGLEVNVLRGVDAWRHLVRTAVGLNSGLPGERDILEQLQASYRLATRAGTVGTLTHRVIRDIETFDRTLRETTEWGTYDPDYCHAAISRVVQADSLDLPGSQIVVIGGSTTSAAVLRTLRERLDVPAQQLTLFYRGHKHGGQVKVLRKAIGNGRRVRVQSYEEPSVREAIAEADVVVFGVDCETPLLAAADLRGNRDFDERPLAVFDFNTFGSTTGLQGLPGVSLFDLGRLDAEVACFAAELCDTERFARILPVIEEAAAKHDWPAMAADGAGDGSKRSTSVASADRARVADGSNGRSRTRRPVEAGDAVA